MKDVSRVEGLERPKGLYNKRFSGQRYIGGKSVGFGRDMIKGSDIPGI